MIKRAILILIGLVLLGGLALAQSPGVFLPFYTIYDNAVAVTPDGVHTPGPVDGHQVLFFNTNPLVSVSTSIESKGYSLDIMRARYFSQFDVAAGGKFKVGVPTGSDGYGMDPVDYPVTGNGFDKVPLNLVYGGGAGLVPADGTVPVDIKADSSGNIILTWDVKKYSSVDVYKLTGDGTGQFDNSSSGITKGGSGWKSVISGLTAGTFLDTKLIAADPKEVYYKVIVNAYAKASIPDLISKAWATGKFDLVLTQGFNLISTPLVPLHGSSIDNVFINASGGGLRTKNEQVYYFNESTGLTIKALYDSASSSWLYFPPGTPFTINLGNGYWVNEVNKTNRISTIGAVITAANHRSLPADFSLIGSPIPTTMDLSIGGLAPKGSNEIYFYHSGTMDKMYNSSGTWTNAVPGAKPFGLYPGVGYWYKNYGSTLDWVLTP